MEGRRREKKRKKVDGGADGGLLVRDGGQLVRDGGLTGRRERRRRGAAVLVVVMVLNKSKSFVVPLSMVLFITHSNLFCTDAEFAPAARVPRVPGDGWLEGSQAGGLAGLYPPLHSYGWDDKSV